MTYSEAKELLRIAVNAYHIGAYDEALDIVSKVAYFIAADKTLSDNERQELTEVIKRAIGMFTSCPDECCWEKSCGLMNLLR